MMTEHRSRVKVLERGEMFFLYRPQVEGFTPEGLLDVRRFYTVLHPEGQARFRLIAIGKKRLPGTDVESQRHWGFVDRVCSSAEELRRAAGGASSVPIPGDDVRPAGEGVYALFLHANHTHLAYVLEVPRLLGEVQEAFNIKAEGRFVIAVKNPQAVSPPGVGLDAGIQADFPDDLQARFGDRRWVPVEPPDFLNYEGAELVLIGGPDDLGEDLGLNLKGCLKDEQSAEIFKELHFEKSDRTINPLFRGVWQ